MKEPSKKTALDSALALGVLVPLVLVPAWLFGRAEIAREISKFDEWRGLCAAKGEQSLPGISFTFGASEAGVDEFGIVRDSALVVRNAEGQAILIPRELENRIKELTAKVRTSHQETGICEPYLSSLLCAVTHGQEVRGALVEATALSFPVAGIVFTLLGVVFLGLALALRFGFSRILAALLGALSGLGGSWYVERNVSKILVGLQAAEAKAQYLIGPAHSVATGFTFVLFCGVVSALLCLALFPSTKSLFENLRHRPLVYAAIAPALIGVFVLVFVPFFMGVYLAFLNNRGEFVGLQNFIEILFPTESSDTNFYFTLGVTIMWTVLNVGLHVVIGLALALLLSDPFLKGRAVYRVLLIVPWAVPNYITALIWKWIFNTQYGPANAFLALIGLDPVDWLGRSFWTNFFANLVTNTWLGFPFMMVISLGALQSIPAELYEAAKIDGAGRWAIFRNITLPLLKPALFPAIILGTIWTFNMFNVVYLVSGGAPDNKTNILITEAYRAFRVLKNYGLAAAYSLIIFFILVAYTAITNRFTKAAESVYE